MKWREWLKEKTRSSRGSYTRGFTSNCGLFSVYKRESGKWSIWQREPTLMLIDGFNSVELARAWCDLHLKRERVPVLEPFYMRKRWANMLFNPDKGLKS